MNKTVSVRKIYSLNKEGFDRPFDILTLLFIKLIASIMLPLRTMLYVTY